MVTSKKNSAKPQTPAMPKINTEASQQGGLGRGLASLIPTGEQKPRLGDSAADVILGDRHSDDSSAATGASKKTSKKSKSSKNVSPKPSSSEPQKDSFGATYLEIPVSAIRANDNQPRSVFDQDALDELVHSISEFGLMQPIVVRPDPKGKKDTYELIMGERRLRASSLAGLESIPAIVRETENEAMLRDALLENIHRVQLNPLEEASAYQQLLDDFDVTHEELAQKIGRSRPVITNMIRLLNLPVSVQRKVGAGVLSAGHAKALLSLKDDSDAQEALADRILSEGLSVRGTEEAALLLQGDKKGKKKKPKTQSTTLPSSVSEWADNFGDSLDTKVSVAMGTKGRGKIVVEFGDLDDFKRITEIITT